MSSETSQLQQMKPYILVAGVLLIILLVVVFWPSSDEPEVKNSDAVNGNNQEMIQTPAKPTEPEVFIAPMTPTPVEITSDMDVDDFEADEVAVEMPEDISDTVIKSALMSVASSPTFSRLLVNDRLIEKFVINVQSLSNESLSPKDNLVVAPETPFSTYQQADRTWIDNSSFKRYNSYVDAIESVDTEELLAIFDNYEATIKAKFSEISRPGEEFDDSLIKAIDVLLNTPQVPVPIEVYSESVMYKYKDERLENLSGPQKQMIRTGPENMRRIKEVLRDLKKELEQR